MTSGARLPGEAILADNGLRETRTVALKFMISPFAKRGLTPELRRPARCEPVAPETAKRARLERIVSPLKPALCWILDDLADRREPKKSFTARRCIRFEICRSAGESASEKLFVAFVQDALC